MCVGFEDGECGIRVSMMKAKGLDKESGRKQGRGTWASCTHDARLYFKKFVIKIYY
jgi:hypothetical protein